MSCTIIVITAILTGLDVLMMLQNMPAPELLFPITGFANAIVSQAITSRSEGFILGLGAKIFTIAGPVILSRYHNFGIVRNNILDSWVIYTLKY